MQGQVFRWPLCPSLSTRKGQLGAGARPRGPGVHDRGTKHPNTAPPSLPSTEVLLQHDPGWTQGQDSECGG